MKKIAQIALLSLIGLSSLMTAKAQVAPGTILGEVTEPTLVVGLGSEPVTLYYNIQNFLSIKVNKQSNPCFNEGTVMVASDDAMVQYAPLSGFQVQPTKMEGTLSVYYRIADQIWKVRDIQFNCTLPKFDDQAFKSVYPNNSWKKTIQKPDNFNPKTRTILTDDDLKVFMPFVVLRKFENHDPLIIQATYENGCEPKSTLILESEDAQIEEAEVWNEFRVTPILARKMVSLRFYHMVDGEKVLIKESKYPVLH